MKKILTSMLILGSVAVSANNKLDLNTAMMIEDYKASLTNSLPKNRLPLSMVEKGATNVGVLVVLNNGADASALEAAGAKVNALRGNVASVSAPLASLERIAALDEVRSITSGSQSANLYFARQITSTNQVIEGTGEGLTQPYTGKGIVTGLVDDGFDPNHINFLTEDLNDTRIKAFYHLNRDNGTYVAYTTWDEIKGFTTDNTKSSHGTHTCGIMAGGYKGNGRYGLSNRSYNNQPIPYYGVASNSDIIMAGGDFTNANIATGIEKIIEYAEENGNKPVVVNLSLGGVLGPHDGSDPLSQFIASAGESSVICISSGNEGDMKCAVTRSFGGFNKTLRTCLKASDPYSPITAQFWYSTDDAFKLEVVFYDTIQNKEVGSMEIPYNGYTSTITPSTSGIGTAFSQGYYSDSYLRFYMYVDPDNNRFVGSLSGFLIPLTGTSVVAGIKITGTSGQNVNGFISGGTFEQNGITGWQDGMTEGSISDLACGENVISVGAFQSSKTFTLINGRSTSYQNSDPTGDVCYFTSFGRTYQGDPRPNLCGPGSTLVSSANYYNLGPSPSENSYSAFTDADGRANQWIAMQGTSMSSPFVSGVCALLLEANPNLTVDEMRAILMETSQLPDYSLSSNEKMQWGAGAVNTYEAIKKALEASGIENVWNDDDMRLMIKTTGEGYEVYVAGEDSVRLTVYDIQGRAIRTASAEGNTATVSTNDLSNGVYLLDIKGSTSHFTRKIALK